MQPHATVSGKKRMNESVAEMIWRPRGVFSEKYSDGERPRQTSFNVSWDAILVAAKFGLLSGADTTTFETMSLGPLALHNLVKHDTSILRNGFGPDGTGDNVHFNETTFSKLANANLGKDYYDPVSAGTIQHAHLTHSVVTNSNIFFREEHLPFAEGWSKPTTLISDATLDPIGTIIQNVSDWTETQSCEPLILGSGIVFH
ncbi:hypothetical protein K438DRAFT_1752731 [Mycena galopus ATCC 62051]|nr:hypothetical protein K438DRAFT_1752731 [Mycena galopus ATCC 62051]